jgi:hypothetical protein
VAELGCAAIRATLGADARGAVVLADDGAAHLIAQNGGLALLAELGVSSMLRLGADEPRALRHGVVALPGAPAPTHVVVLSTQPIDELGVILERTIDRAFDRCVVLCSIASLSGHEAPDVGPPARDWRARRSAASSEGGRSGGSGEAASGSELEYESELDQPSSSGHPPSDGAAELRGGVRGSAAGSRASSDSSQGEAAAEVADAATAAVDEADDLPEHDVRRILAAYQSRWSARLGVRVQVRPLRVLMVALGPRAFVLPGHCALFPLLPADARALERAEDGEDAAAASDADEPAAARGSDGGGGGSRRARLRRADSGAAESRPAEYDWDALPAEAACALDKLAHSLLALIDALGPRAELFSLGATSRVLARRLNTMTLSLSTDAEAAREEDEGGSVAIVLIDRTLDLVTPMLAAEGPLDALALRAQAEEFFARTGGGGPAARPRARGEGPAQPLATSVSPVGAWRDDAHGAALADELLLAGTRTDAAVCVQAALLDLLARTPALREAVQPPAAERRVTVESAAALLAALRAAIDARVAAGGGDGCGGGGLDCLSLLELAQLALDAVGAGAERWHGPAAREAVDEAQVRRARLAARSDARNMASPHACLVPLVSSLPLPL